MHDELYTDGVGEITVSGTIVRVDLVSLSPTEREQLLRQLAALRAGEDVLKWFHFLAHEARDPFEFRLERWIRLEIP